MSVTVRCGPGVRRLHSHTPSDSPSEPETNNQSVGLSPGQNDQLDLEIWSCPIIFDAREGFISFSYRLNVLVLALNV